MRLDAATPVSRWPGYVLLAAVWFVYVLLGGCALEGFTRVFATTFFAVIPAACVGYGIGRASRRVGTDR
jgi:hypothetical protein